MDQDPKARSTRRLMLIAALLVALAGIAYAVTGGGSGALDADANSTTSPDAPKAADRGDCEPGSVQLKSDPTRCVPETGDK